MNVEAVAPVQQITVAYNRHVRRDLCPLRVFAVS
jgi:hypothetical protein